MPDLERFGVSMDHELLAAFDRVIERKGYPSRSEAIRDLVRDLMVRERWEHSDAPVVGAITLVYDHHASMLEDRLVDLQHRYADLVHATTHVHLDERHCVEVVVVSGPADRVRELADRITAIKGVQHAQLSGTAVAWESPAHEHDHEHQGAEAAEGHRHGPEPHRP